MGPPDWVLFELDRRAIGSDRAWQALSGGRTNQVWQAGDLVLKLFAPEDDNPLFANDPRAETRALAHFHALGMATKPLALIEGDAGTALLSTAAEVTQPGGAEKGALLRRLHALPAVGQMRRLPADLCDIAAWSARILERSGALADLAPDLGTPPALRLRLAALHGDPVAANFVGGKSGCLLVDWQSAALGPAALDLAIALSPAMMLLYPPSEDEDAHGAALLATYGECDDYARAAPWLHHLILAYCLWQANLGRTEYRAAAERERVFLQALTVVT